MANLRNYQLVCESFPTSLGDLTTVTVQEAEKIQTSAQNLKTNKEPDACLLINSNKEKQNGLTVEIYS